MPIFESVSVGYRTRVDAFRTPRSIVVLDRKRLREKGPRSVPEALMEEAGIFVQKTNHGGGAPFIRGAVGPQVLILVDGVRLNNSTYRAGPNQYLNLIDPHNLRRLEVLRGPGSIAYGSYAFGGVISALSRKTPMTSGSRFRYQGALLGRYGSSDNELSAHASFGGSAGNVGFRGSVTYGSFGNLLGGSSPTPEGSVGSRYLIKPTGFGDIALRGDTGRQAFSGYQQFFANGEVRWRIRSGWELKLAYQRAQFFRAGRADQFVSKGRVRYYDNVRDLVYLQTKGKSDKLRTRMRLTLSYQRQEEVRDQQALDPKNNYKMTRQDINRDQTHTVGASWQGNTRVTSWMKLSYGIDFYGDFVESEARRSKNGGDFKERAGNFPQGSTYFTLGAYVLARFRLWEWKPRSGFYLHVGERLNGFFATAPARPDVDAVAFQQVGQAPYASLQFLASPSFNISFSYAEGFRAPNLQEAVSLGDQGNNFEVSNPNLTAEISRTLELTVRTRWRRRVRAWVTGYVSFWNNLIDKQPGEYKGQKEVDGKAVIQLVNTANARVMGLEAGGSWRIWRGLQVSGHLTWTQGRAVTPHLETPLSRIPPLFAKTAISYRFGKRAFLELYVLAAGTQKDLSKRDQGDPRIPKGGTPGWWTLNLRGGARLTSFARINFLVENFFNTPYKYHGSGVLGPGLSARILLEMTL